MGLTIRTEDEDYPGLSDTCECTAIRTVFVDNEKNEIIIISNGESIVISTPV